MYWHSASAEHSYLFYGTTTCRLKGLFSWNDAILSTVVELVEELCTRQLRHEYCQFTVSNKMQVHFN